MGMSSGHDQGLREIIEVSPRLAALQKPPVPNSVWCACLHDTRCCVRTNLLSTLVSTARVTQPQCGQIMLEMRPWSPQLRLDPCSFRLRHIIQVQAHDVLGLVGHFRHNVAHSLGTQEHSLDFENGIWMART